MTKEEFVEMTIKLLGMYDVLFNAGGSLLQIVANSLDMKAYSFGKSYYFMFLLFELLLGFYLMMNSKKVADWVLKLGRN
jgi:hypothetical protein